MNFPHAKNNMNKKDKSELLDRLESLIKRRELASIDRVIQSYKCYFCARSWRRGGKRDGKMLCENCYAPDSL